MTVLNIVLNEYSSSITINNTILYVGGSPYGMKKGLIKTYNKNVNKINIYLDFEVLETYSNHYKTWWIKYFNYLMECLTFLYNLKDFIKPKINIIQYNEKKHYDIIYK